MTILLLTLLTNQAYSKGYLGSMTFTIETNIPGVEFDGKIEKLSFTNESSNSLKILPNQITTGIELRDDHLREKVLGNKPILLKTTLCSDLKNCELEIGIELNGKKSSIKVKLKHSKNLKFSHTLSLKKLGIFPPSYLGITIEDAIDISGEFNVL
jgi:hypothetical protein